MAPEIHRAIALHSGAVGLFVRHWLALVRPVIRPQRPRHCVHTFEMAHGIREMGLLVIVAMMANMSIMRAMPGMRVSVRSSSVFHVGSPCKCGTRSRVNVHGARLKLMYGECQRRGTGNGAKVA